MVHTKKSQFNSESKPLFFLQLEKNLCFLSLLVADYFMNHLYNILKSWVNFYSCLLNSLFESVLNNFCYQNIRENIEKQNCSSITFR